MGVFITIRPYRRRRKGQFADYYPQDEEKPPQLKRPKPKKSIIQQPSEPISEPTPELPP
jgi:hypothetical protein